MLGVGGRCGNWELRANGAKVIWVHQTIAERAPYLLEAMPIKDKVKLFISLFNQRFAIIVHNTAKRVFLGGTPQ